MGGNLIQPFSAVQSRIPTRVIAALFQKDPQAIFAHPGQYRHFSDLRTAPIFISSSRLHSFYRWIITRHGFKEENVHPSTYNVAPFLNNPRLAQQGYITNEPFQIRTQGGFEPDVFLLADNGWKSYSTTIEAH